MKKALIVLTSVFALGQSPTRPAPVPVSCSAQVSGGAGILNGTYPCFPRVVFDSTKHAMVFSLSLSTPGSGSVVQLSVAVEAPQVALRPDTFVLGTGGVTGATTFTQTAGSAAPAWAALKSKTSALVGESTLELSDLGQVTNTQGKQLYLSPEGSLSATMQPQDGSGANGTVNLQLTF
jgi:hypothetical protein